MSKKSIPCLLFAVLLPALANAANLTAETRALLDGAAKHAGFSLRNSDGKEILNVNGDELLAPASTAKTISTGCSLTELGPQFKFNTDFGYVGTIENETLNGDLVVRGHGDPSLVTGDLYEIVQILRYAHGLRKITGHIIFDVSYFAAPSLPISDDFGGDEGRSFTTVLTPAPFNQNSFAVWATADSENHTSAHVTVLPEKVLDLDVKNETKVGGSTSMKVQFDPNQNQVHVTGQVERGTEKAIYRGTKDVYAYYDRLMRRLWLESGGEWADSALAISNGPVLKMKLLHSHPSRALAKILMDTNKLSLNLSAELILLAASVGDNGPASFEKSHKFLNSCLSKFAISTEDVKMVNASGLARDSKVKPSAMSLFLHKMSRQFVAAEYMSSFSLAGIDGSAAARLKDFSGRLRVKTGTIQGVRAITGYLYGKNQELYSFSMLLNGLKLPDDQVKTKEDQILANILRAY